MMRHYNYHNLGHIFNYFRFNVDRQNEKCDVSLEKNISTLKYDVRIDKVKSVWRPNTIKFV